MIISKGGARKKQIVPTLSFGYSDGMTPAPEWLNYHHLRHFWMIARHRSMARAAEVLNISPSTLSEQLAELEDSLGHKLFDRRGRTLHLTESGRVALEHAETIFSTGRELLGRFRQSDQSPQRVLRIGAVSPLSKNLQFDFVEPLLADIRFRIVVSTGALDSLLRQLHEHQLDLVLSNVPVRADQDANIFNHLLGRVPVFLAARERPAASRFPRYLHGLPVFLPSHQSQVRGDFDVIMANSGVEPLVRGEVDDMALLRLLALSGQGVALVSKIVVERDLQSRQLKFLQRVPGLEERYFALTIRRKFESAWLGEIITSFRSRLKSLSSSNESARVPSKTRKRPNPPSIRAQ